MVMFMFSVNNLIRSNLSDVTKWTLDRHHKQRIASATVPSSRLGVTGEDLTI